MIDEKMLGLIMSSIGEYVSIKGTNGFSYSNIPDNFNTSSNDVKYSEKYYEKNTNSFVNGNVEYTIMSFKDVTEFKKKVNEDAKTGILSATGFNEEIVKLITSKQQFVLGMFDVDNFKHFNDTYGHDIGDEVLNAAAQVFKHNIKSDDLVGRFGGDEFMFAMKNIDPEIAKRRIRTLNERLGSGLKFTNGQVIPISLSIGIKNYDYNLSYEENAKAVDNLLYVSKNNGKNQISTEKGKAI